MRTIAIHQPNFLPWLGFFHKIRWSDEFLFLDDALVQKTGSSWSNRVKLISNDGGRWVTAPIDRNYSGYLRLCDQRFSGDTGWRKKLAQSLRSDYGRTAHFDEIFTAVTSLLAEEIDLLATFNAAFIRWGMAVLELDTPVRNTSELSVLTTSTRRLVELVSAVGGNRYMCGRGALAYQEDELFETAGIAVLHQDFAHPVYPQRGQQTFVPGLSILDALFNLGPRATRSLLETPPPGW